MNLYINKLEAYQLKMTEDERDLGALVDYRILMSQQYDAAVEKTKVVLYASDELFLLEIGKYSFHCTRPHPEVVRPHPEC